MIYELEALAVALKTAREQKGYSQRDLSARSGVRQSQISKIENADVDLRISSLNAIAHALDLEVTLIPRKAVPAVKSIARNTITPPNVTPDVARLMAQIGKQLEFVKNLNIDMSIMSNLLRHYKELQQFQNLILDTTELNQIHRSMNTFAEVGGVKALQRVAKQMSDVRNTLAHSDPRIKVPELPRSAYQLEGDEDG